MSNHLFYWRFSTGAGLTLTLLQYTPFLWKTWTHGCCISGMTIFLIFLYLGGIRRAKALWGVYDDLFFS
jgi:hypothetical protein